MDNHDLPFFEKGDPLFHGLDWNPSDDSVREELRSCDSKFPPILNPSLFSRKGEEEEILPGANRSDCRDLSDEELARLIAKCQALTREDIEGLLRRLGNNLIRQRKGRLDAAKKEQARRAEERQSRQALQQDIEGPEITQERLIMYVGLFWWFCKTEKEGRPVPGRPGVLSYHHQGALEVVLGAIHPWYKRRPGETSSSYSDRRKKEWQKYEDLAKQEGYIGTIPTRKQQKKRYWFKDKAVKVAEECGPHVYLLYK